ncbi:MAG TPA: phosphatase PAP2 family protein [Stellaceae bacterium]|nr:phosphatase PAP2 family protein [Stellaceae bacterium]
MSPEVKAILLYLVALSAAIAVFLLAPGLDLWASGLFFRPGEGFFLANAGVVRALYRAVPWIVAAEAIGIPLLLAVGWWRGRWLLGIAPKQTAFVLLVLALGPGGAVNTVLKDHWGRARPSQVTEFGGAQAFTPAPLPATGCDRNCSFVSGHASVGFGLIAFAFLAGDRRRRRALAAGAIATGTAIGLARMAQGAHFLSDVVFAGLVVCGIAWLLAWALLKRDIAGALWRNLTRRLGSAGTGWALYGVLTLTGIAASIVFIDRPVALYFHQASPAVAEAFRAVTRLGVSTYYLIGTAVLALAFWLAGRFGQGRWAARLGAAAVVPLFLFLAIAVSGLITDLLKVVFGRARPKLLFANETFGFDWWGTKVDFWSFPSGHATTVVAIAAALFCLWPRFLPLYVGFAVLVSLSRAVIGAHYVSDVIAATFIAIATTAYLRHLFERSGIALREAARGHSRRSAPARERLGLGKAEGG